VHDLLLDGNVGLANVCVYLNTNPITGEVFNGVNWDQQAGGILLNATSGPMTVENWAAYASRATVGFNLINTAVVARNCTAYDNNTNDFVNIGAATGRYCRSSDATAADVNWAAALGNTINAVVLNDVQGVNDAVANFFDILAGGPLDGAGEVNAIAARAVCIRNRAVPGPNGTSVGPAEIVTPEPTPTPTTRNPSTTQSHVAMPAAIAMY
jgi:hypothetical protein